MVLTPLRWGIRPWADPIWWAEQQLKVITATATYLASVTQAFAGAAAAETAEDGSGERSAEETDAAEQTGQTTTLTVVKRADAVPVVVDGPSIPAVDAPSEPPVMDAPSEPPVMDAPSEPPVITVDDQGRATPEEDTPEEELPVARWDELSLGSIRARLSRLSEADLAYLHRYEEEHAGRPAVLSMLTNRLAKIQAEGGSAAASGS